MRALCLWNYQESVIETESYFSSFMIVERYLIAQDEKGMKKYIL